MRSTLYLRICAAVFLGVALAVNYAVPTQLSLANAVNSSSNETDPITTNSSEITVDTQEEWKSLSSSFENMFVSDEGFTFSSIPDFINWNVYYPQPGWENALDWFLGLMKEDAFVLHAGDVMDARWWDSREQVREETQRWWGAFKKRFDDKGIKLYVAPGDHEYGDDKGTRMMNLVPVYAEQFAPSSDTPKNGPELLGVKGLAYSFTMGNVGFISVNTWENAGGHLSKTVSGKQLEWVENQLKEFRDNKSIEFIIVQGHVPVFGPVNSANSSRNMLEGGTDSEFWQTMVKYGVDAYFCGEHHRITAKKRDGIWQIVHGALWGTQTDVNYLKGACSPGRLELKLFEFPVEYSGGYLENHPHRGPTNRPRERVSIPESVRENGPSCVGELVIIHGENGNMTTKATGEFSKYIGGITYECLSISENVIGAGMTTTVSVAVQNFTDVSRDEIVNLYVDDRIVDSKHLSLDAGDYEIVSFEVPFDSFDGAGSHEVRIGNLSGSVMVYNMDLTPPSAPTGLSATAINGNQIYLDWDDNPEPDLDHYSVYRGQSSGFSVGLDSIVDNTTSSDFVDTGLSENMTYYYKVTAVDNVGNESDPSDEVSVTTPPLVPEFELSDLSVSKTVVEPSESFTVSVDVANVGQASGPYTVELSLDGELYDTQTVTLDPGQSTTVSFTVSSDEVGTHEVSVGGLTGSFEVSAPEGGGLLVWLLVAIIVIILVASVILIKRKRRKR